MGAVRKACKEVDFGQFQYAVEHIAEGYSLPRPPSHPDKGRLWYIVINFLGCIRFRKRRRGREQTYTRDNSSRMVGI